MPEGRSGSTFGADRCSPPEHNLRRTSAVILTTRPTSSLLTPSALGHMEHEHSDIIILLISGQHPFNQVLKEPIGMPDHLRRRLARDREQFVKTAVQAALAVLY